MHRIMEHYYRIKRFFSNLEDVDMRYAPPIDEVLCILRWLYINDYGEFEDFMLILAAAMDNALGEFEAYMLLLRSYINHGVSHPVQ